MIKVDVDEVKQRTLYEILTLAILYAKGEDPMGLERFLGLKDKGKTGMFTTRYEGKRNKILMALKDVLRQVEQAAAKEKQAGKVITPADAAKLDGEQVYELKVASNTDIGALVEKRQKDNKKGLPENENDQMLKLLGLKGSKTEAPEVEDELSVLYK